MLAQCEAGLRHFDACSEILTAAFEGEDKPIAEELHTAFVFHKLGLRDDAIRRREQAGDEVRKHADAMPGVG